MRISILARPQFVFQILRAMICDFAQIGFPYLSSLTVNMLIVGIAFESSLYFASNALYSTTEISVNISRSIKLSHFSSYSLFHTCLSELLPASAIHIFSSTNQNASLWLIYITHYQILSHDVLLPANIKIIFLQLFLNIISQNMSFCQNKRGDIWPKLPYFPTFYCHQLESICISQGRNNLRNRI